MISIPNSLRYKYGVSNASTSALETARKRAGVCRDFAHLGIALGKLLLAAGRAKVALWPEKVQQEI